MNTIAEIIKTERINRNLTQKAVAELLGVTQDIISLWENGKRIPDTQYLKDLCKIFDVSADYLLGLEDDFGVRLTPIHSADTNYTDEERALIEEYRKLPADSKKLILRMIGVTSDTQTTKKKA